LPRSSRANTQATQRGLRGRRRIGDVGIIAGPTDNIGTLEVHL